MKRVFRLLVAIVFLTGCDSADRDMKTAMHFRDALLSADGCSFRANITADYADSIYSFAMDCKADNGGNLSFEIVEPETIAGIGGTISQSGGSIRFADTELVFELLADGQISPAAAPWIFLKTLRSGYLTSCVQEENLLHLTVDDSYAEDALKLDIWLKEGTCPVRADVLYGGKRILSVDVENFVLS